LGREHLDPLGRDAHGVNALVEGFHDGLFKSAGHRTNILSDAFKEVGIGIGFGEYKGSNGADATQNFARSGGATFLTGVAFDDKDGDRFYDPARAWGSWTSRSDRAPARPTKRRPGTRAATRSRSPPATTPSPSPAAAWPRPS
jgi:hypothetical protein